MSTRATIKIFDQYDQLCIYRHMDGYPHGEHGVPATIQEACAYAWLLPRFEAGDFAAALVRAWKGQGGGNIYLSNGHQSHGDTEYQYNLSAKDGRLWIGVQEVGWGDGEEATRRRETLFEGCLEDAISHFQEEAG
jgi:hypothetical protein